MKLPCRKDALEVLQKLQTAGFGAWFAKGTVRALAMGELPFSYTIYTTAAPEAVISLFAENTPVGSGTGVCFARELCSFTVQPLEEEQASADTAAAAAAMPGVQRTVPQALVSRLTAQAFTVNAMAYDGRETIIDPCGGRDDIRRRRIRTVDEPTRAYRDNPLLILGTFRMASMLGFGIDEAALAAALACRYELSTASLPEIRKELQALLLGKQPVVLEPFLQAGGLNILGLRDDVSLSILEAVPCGMLLRWWAFFTLTQADKKLLCSYLEFPQSFYSDLVCIDALFSEVCTNKMRLKRSASDLPVPMEDVLIAFTALDSRFQPSLAVWREVLAAGEAYRMDQLAVSSKMLLAMGMRERQIGKCMRLLLETVTAEPSCNEKNRLYQIAMSFWQLGF